MTRKCDNSWILDDKTHWEGNYAGSAHIISYNGTDITVSDFPGTIEITKVGSSAYKISSPQGGLNIGLSVIDSATQQYQLVVADANDYGINTFVATKIHKHQVKKFKSLAQQPVPTPTPNKFSFVSLGSAKLIK